MKKAVKNPNLVIRVMFIVALLMLGACIWSVLKYFS